jgi:hypothetical protein
MKMKIRGWVFLLLTVMFFLGSTAIPVGPVYAADSKVLYVNFGGSSVVDGKFYRSLSSITGQTVNFNSAGKKVGYWEVRVNGGAAQKNLGTLTNDVLTLPAITGIQKPVFNIEAYNPGHIIYRNSAGNRWRTGVTGSRYEFSPTSCTAVPSGCPGVFPATAYNMDTGVTEPMPSILRDSSGRAVTTMRNVPSPGAFYLTAADVGEYSKKIYKADTLPSSIQINKPKTKPSPSVFNVVVIDAGKGVEPGSGYLQVGKALTSSNSIPGIDYIPMDDSGMSGHAEGRNYYMTVDAYWEAVTYEYAATVTVYYEPTGGLPDLVALDIVNIDPIVINKPVKFKFIYQNLYADVTQPFEVTVWDENNVVLARETKNGMKKDEKAELIFYATFPDGNKRTFTGYVDSGGGAFKIDSN